MRYFAKGPISFFLPVFLLLFGLVLASGVGLAEPIDYSRVLRGYDSMLENDYLQLFVNQSTGEFVVRVKETEQLWYSNPPARQREETILRGRAKDRLSSQITITYFAPDDVRRTMDSYNDSVAIGQMTVVPLDDGVRVEYLIGREWQDRDWYPVMIAQERLETLILENISGRMDRNFVQGNYDLIMLRELTEDEEQITVFNVQDSVFEGLTVVMPENTRPLTDRQQRDLLTNLADHIVANRADIDNRQGIQREYVEHLIDNPTYVLRSRLSPWDIEDMIEILQDIDYRPEQVQIDHGAASLDRPEQNVEVFFVPIEYRLDGPDFLARVPVNEVVFPHNVVDRRGRFGPVGGLVSYPLHSVNVLEFMGAASMSDEGYFFVPDGSGALIDFNNEKAYLGRYSELVYGRDDALEFVRERRTVSQLVHLPVFGVKKEDRGFVAIIEEGDAFARINAGVSGRDSSYNTVFADFIVRPRSVSRLQTGATWMAMIPSRSEINAYQARMQSSDIGIRYSFLAEDDANFVGMAGRYQEYLVEKYGLERLSPRDHIPLFIELVGAVEQRLSVLGIPRDVSVPLTTFDQAQEIVAELRSRDVNNLILRYTGWLDGGIYHGLPRNARIDSSLGNRQSFISLQEYLQGQGVTLFPEVGFMQVYARGWFDGFSSRTDAARFLDRQVARLEGFNPASSLRNFQRYFLLSPHRFERVISGFMNDFERFGIDALSPGQFGWRLYSDFGLRPEELVDRQQAQAIVVEKLQAWTDDGYRLMLERANAYAIPYASAIVSVPGSDSLFDITDRRVPFYQMVISGFLDYAGDPMNISGDHRRDALRAIEVGASPYYQWAYTDLQRPQPPRFDHLHAVKYEYWIDEAVALYLRINDELRVVRGQRMVYHERLASNVYQTTYENGYAVIVNYNRSPVVVGGVHVPAEDFIIVEEAISVER